MPIRKNKYRLAEADQLENSPIWAFKAINLARVSKCMHIFFAMRLSFGILIPDLIQYFFTLLERNRRTFFCIRETECVRSISKDVDLIIHQSKKGYVEGGAR